MKTIRIAFIVFTMATCFRGIPKEAFKDDYGNYFIYEKDEFGVEKSCIWDQKKDLLVVDSTANLERDSYSYKKGDLEFIYMKRVLDKERLIDRMYDATGTSLIMVSVFTRMSPIWLQESELYENDEVRSRGYHIRGAGRASKRVYHYNPPIRNRSIPAEAEWDTRFQRWAAGTYSDGVKNGHWNLYLENGGNGGRVTYDRGMLHGPFEIVFYDTIFKGNYASGVAAPQNNDAFAKIRIPFRKQEKYKCH